jgi:pimeloyl-ACP methyl ester carboxylesterase
MNDGDIRSVVMAFRSGIDGTEQRAGICGPAEVQPGVTLPLLVELEPASILDLDGTLSDGRRHLELLGEPAVWLRPGGRGPGTVFQGYGAVDVFEAIEAAATHYPIDADRISLYGFSMGGAGVWYLASHHPDRFAAIAPMGGYNDYRLWRRPGGMTFPLFTWEEPSWRARSAVLLLENLRHVGIWMVHGAWDRAVGGGVDVEHARQSARLLDELGIEHRLTELAETGHDSRFMHEPFFGEILRWLTAHRRPASPDRVSFRTSELQHHRAYWADIEQIERYGTSAALEALAGPHGVTVTTENVRHLVIRPSDRAATTGRLRVDTTEIPGADLTKPVGLRLIRGNWELADLDPAPGEKRPGISGPFGGLFERQTILVTGTIGTVEESFFLDWAARDAAYFFKERNGGVHRGGIAGESWMDLPILTDVEWLEAERSETGIRTVNVLAYGSPHSNAVLARFAERLPASVGPGEIIVGGRRFIGPGLALIAVLAFPDDGGDRYLGVHGGTSPDAITSGAHLNWQLLPDYLVYDASSVLEWGYFDNAWNPIPEIDHGAAPRL